MANNEDKNIFPYSWIKVSKIDLPEITENRIERGIAASNAKYWIVVLKYMENYRDIKYDDGTMLNFIETTTMPIVTTAFRTFNPISNEWVWATQMFIAKEFPLRSDETIYRDEDVTHWMPYEPPKLPADYD